MKKFRRWTVMPVLLLLCVCAHAQDKQYFDKAGKVTSSEDSYYYRQPHGDGIFKSYYTANGSMYFEGGILQVNNQDDNLCKYKGECTWYYKNGQKKAVRHFNEQGQENGTSTYYYESGKMSKEMLYTNGVLDPTKIYEYSEDGVKSRIFEEKFENNSNDWDLYDSDKTAAVIYDGMMELTSYNEIGASRYLNIVRTSDEFAFEAKIDNGKAHPGQKSGIIFAFKDWSNYNYFMISGTYFYVGSVFEGVNSYNAEGMFGSSIVESGLNTLKVISDGEKIVYSVNGEVEYSLKTFHFFGSNFGFALSGKGSMIIEEMTYKEFDAGSEVFHRPASDAGIKSSGSGVLFSPKGYIMTNYHVVENANQVLVELRGPDDEMKTYKAKVVQQDKDNDLAIIQVDDASFKEYNDIRYSFRSSGLAEVGAEVFTLGYPMALSGMGKEVKFTDGKISSKTGFNNSVNSYQTSIPVQPGNSGGPLFAANGELVGLINAKIMQADNVSYAIKLSYMRNLIDLLPDSPKVPADTSIQSLSLEDKVKVLSYYVALIKVK